MKLLTQLLLLVSLSGLTGAAIVGNQSADLSAVTVADGSPANITDIADLLGQATIKRSALVEISEADLNRYLAATLSGRQAGRSAWLAGFEKVLVDFEQGEARITLCWLVGGHRTTTTVHLHVALESGKHRAELTGGAYGRMPVVRGFLAPVIPAYQELARACSPEIGSILSMTKIRIAKNKLILDPRF